MVSLVYRKVSFKKISCSFSQNSCTEVIHMLFSTVVCITYLSVSEIMHQGTTCSLVHQNIKNRACSGLRV